MKQIIKKSNNFLFCWKRPRPRFRRHQERM